MSLFGCAEKYHVDYDGRKSAYTNAKDAYRAGETVRLYYEIIAMDTDYSFFLDGQRINYTYDDAHGFVIKFEMPAHDVKLTCRMENSMMYNPEETREPYLVAEFATGTCGTPGFDDRTTYALTTGGADDRSTLTVTKEQDADGSKVTQVYSAPAEAAYQVAALIDSLQLREWKYLTDGDCIDGSFTSVRFRNDDGSYETASTDNMPAGGEAMLHQVGRLLQQYATEENRLQ